MLCIGPYTNSNYAKFGVKSSSKCQYRNEEKQDFKRLFQECPGVREQRDRLEVKWQHRPSEIGTGITTSENRAMTFIMLELNHCIQITNWKEGALSLANFKKGLRATENVERRIAMKKGKQDLHEAKWQKIFDQMR